MSYELAALSEWRCWKVTILQLPVSCSQSYNIFLLD